MSRFGDQLFSNTDAENFCIGLLDGIEELEDEDDYKPASIVVERFMSRPEVMPNTLSDCLHEIHYWRQLWWLRRSININQADNRPEASVRSRFIERLLCKIKPRNKAESTAVIEWIANSDFPSLSDDDVKGIVLNVIR